MTTKHGQIYNYFPYPSKSTSKIFRGVLIKISYIPPPPFGSVTMVPLKYLYSSVSNSVETTKLKQIKKTEIVKYCNTVRFQAVYTPRVKLIETL